MIVNERAAGERRIQSFIFILASVFCIIFIVLGILEANARKYQLIYLFLVPIVLTLLLSGLYTYRNIFKSKYIDIILIFLIAFLPRYLLAATTWATPFNDFDLYYRTSKTLADGNLDMIRGTLYTVRYPFLQAFSVFQSFLMEIFGQEMIVLRVLYSCMSSLSCVVIYLIGSRYDRRVGLFSGCIASLYISNIVFSSVLTCQHISTLLYYIAFYIFTTKYTTNKQILLKYLFSGIILGFAQLMRAIAPPILLAIFIYSIIKMWIELDMKSKIIASKRKIKTIMKATAIPLFSLFLLLISYQTVVKSFDVYAYLKGYRDVPFIETKLKFKFLLGLNYSGTGYSNSEVRRISFEGTDEEKDTMFQAIITDTLKNPKVLINEIVIPKLTKQWSSIDLSFYWLYGAQLQDLKDQIDSGTLGKYADIKRYYNTGMMQMLYNNIDYATQIAIMFFAAIGFFVSRKISAKNQISLYAWIILGYIAVHMIIEAQQRYRYFGMPIFFLFAAIGIVHFMDIVIAHKSKDRMVMVGERTHQIESGS